MEGTWNILQASCSYEVTSVCPSILTAADTCIQAKSSNSLIDSGFEEQWDRQEESKLRYLLQISDLLLCIPTGGQIPSQGTKCKTGKS